MEEMRIDEKNTTRTGDEKLETIEHEDKPKPPHEQVNVLLDSNVNDANDDKAAQDQIDGSKLNDTKNEVVDMEDDSDEQEENGFVVLKNDVVLKTPSDARATDSDRASLYQELERELHDQIKRCQHYQEVFTQAGDMGRAAQFRAFTAASEKDLNLLRIRWKNGDKLPMVKHEQFSFLMVPCNTELGSNDLIVEFKRGINLKVSERSYTYMKLEFPYPQERKPTAKVTPCQSSNPDYNQTIKFHIDRESRVLQRVVKRKPIEVALYKKEKFWRCDTKLGTFTIKLTELANQCTLHECCSVMNGRRPTDSKIEVIVKIRQALVNKEPVKVDEKWLVFGSE